MQWIASGAFADVYLARVADPNVVRVYGARKLGDQVGMWMELVRGCTLQEKLQKNQPNPFSPETRIVFELPQAGKVELGIYSPDGRLVRALVTGERQAGVQEVRWDGQDDAGRKLPGGVYFYGLRAPGVTESRRMILLP